MVSDNLCRNYGVPPAIWHHLVLPATQHRWICPALTPAKQTGNRFNYPESWVDLGLGCSLYTEMVYIWVWKCSFVSIVLTIEKVTSHLSSHRYILLPCISVVLIDVQHNDGIRQRERSISICKRFSIHPLKQQRHLQRLSPMQYMWPQKKKPIQ